MANNKNILTIGIILVIAFLVVKPDLGFLGAILSEQEVPSEIGTADSLRQGPDGFLSQKYGRQCWNSFTQMNTANSHYADTSFTSIQSGETFTKIHFLDREYTKGSGSYSCVTATSETSFDTKNCKSLFDFTVGKNDFFTNTMNILEVTITNNYGEVTNVLIDAFLVHELDDGSLQYIDLTQDVLVLNEGVNLPKELILQALPFGRYELFISISSLVGNQLGDCGGHTAHIDITDVKHFGFPIHPQLTSYPSFDGQCPEGYELVGLACIIEDLVEQFDCTQEGFECPVTSMYEYACSSTGICSEIIWRVVPCETDIDCGFGLSCNAETNICYNTILEPIIVECVEGESLPSFCEGVTVSCINGKIITSGECKPIISDCLTKGCPEDYVCDASTGVCNYVPGQPPTPIEPTPTGLNIYLLIGILIIGFILLMIFKKK